MEDLAENVAVLPWAIEYTERALANARDRRPTPRRAILSNLDRAYKNLREVRRAIEYCDGIPPLGDMGKGGEVSYGNKKSSFLPTQLGDTLLTA